MIPDYIVIPCCGGEPEVDFPGRVVNRCRIYPAGGTGGVPRYLKTLSLEGEGRVRVISFHEGIKGVDQK